jgi:hypothetical protein
VVSMLTASLVPATGLPVVGPAVAPLETVVTGAASALSTGGTAPTSLPGPLAPPPRSTGPTDGAAGATPGPTPSSTSRQPPSPGPPVTSTPDTEAATPPPCLALPGLPLLGLTTTTLPLCVGS